MEIEYKGRHVKFDDEDLPIFASRPWALAHSRSSLDNRYLVNKGLSFHRLLMGLGKGDIGVVDHINGDTLDNRRSNLRIATKCDNARNQKNNIDRTWRGNRKSSPYKGVWLNKKTGKYRASLTFEGKNIKLGTHSTPQSAALAYNEAAVMFFGEFATLNAIE